MTCICLVARDVGQESHLAGALHGCANLDLVAAARTRDAARPDLALLGDERTQGGDVLVVDLLHLVAAEAAVAPARLRAQRRPAARRRALLSALLRLCHRMPPRTGC